MAWIRDVRVVVIASILALAACSPSATPTSAPSSPSPVAKPTPTPSPSPTPTRTVAPAPTGTFPPLPAGISPFTGRGDAKPGPVLAVKIDNVRQARPPTHLAQADLIYVEPVEAGLSRMMAVFSSQLPSIVGPVRSARESDLGILAQFGAPAFAYSGAKGTVLPLIADAPLVDVSPDHAGNAYERHRDRPAPHNLYAEPQRLLKRAPKASLARDIGFRFGAAPAGGQPKTTYSVKYSAFTIGFRWNASHRSWTISMDGRPIRDAAGSPAAPATVVVQYARIQGSRFKDAWGNVSPHVDTVGSGRALVLRDGRAYEGRWNRPTSKAGTRYTTPAGQPLPFATGQTWVVFAPA